MKNLDAFFRVLAKACLCSSVVFLTLCADAQSYFPAGLGNGNLQLWLTAADPTTVLNPGGTPAANGDFVATWKDKSGRGADATQPTSGNQPVYWTGQLNGLGGVIFQNSNEYLTGPTGSYQTVVATRAINSFGYQYLFSSPANTDYSVRFKENAYTGYIYYSQGPNGEDWDAWANYPYNLWLNGVEGLQTNATTHILVDEAPGAIAGTYSVSNTFSGRGMYSNDPVYELIVYNGTPNNTQRVLLENYQAAEWGLTGSLPTSGYTVFTPPTSTTYNKNLVGIGNSGSDNFLADVAGSTDGFGFSSGSSGSDFLGSAGYAMAAHNAQPNTVNYNPTLPGVPADMYVWNRSWYVELSYGNSSGNITLSFNFDDYNGSSPDPAANFSLLYNPTDGTFGSGTNFLLPTVSSSVAGNRVSFVVNALYLSKGYYTIFYDANTVLPVAMDNFSVAKVSADVAVANWTAAPGFGGGHFAVERSTDGLRFTSLGTVAADVLAGNYSFTDRSPSPGVDYYRLALVNAAGDISYSQVKMLTFGDSSALVTLYPSPAKDVLHISAPGMREARDIELVSVTGQVLERCAVPSLDGATLSVSRLAPGAYFVRIRGGGLPLMLAFLKE